MEINCTRLSLSASVLWSKYFKISSTKNIFIHVIRKGSLTEGEGVDLLVVTSLVKLLLV